MDGGGGGLLRRCLHKVDPGKSRSPLCVCNTAQSVEGVGMLWLLRHKLAVEACGCRQITAAVGLTRLQPRSGLWLRPVSCVKSLLVM